jgi:hypothetical protein
MFSGMYGIPDAQAWENGYDAGQADAAEADAGGGEDMGGDAGGDYGGDYGGSADGGFGDFGGGDFGGF